MLVVRGGYFGEGLYSWGAYIWDFTVCLMHLEKGDDRLCYQIAIIHNNLVSNGISEEGAGLPSALHLQINLTQFCYT